MPRSRKALPWREGGLKVNQELTAEIDFDDKAINDLYIKKGNRKYFNFFKNF